MTTGALTTAVGLGSTLILTPSMIRLAHRFDLVDRPDSELKVHNQPVPTIGGSALGLSALTAVAITGQLSPLPAFAAILAVLVGLIDDIRPLKLWPKLAGQSGIAILIVASAHLGAVGSTVLFVASVAALNAVNLMDGQDGLATGLAIEATAGLTLVAIALDASRAPFDLALIGGLAAFLVWNKPRARIFLGDSGAYLIAVVLLLGEIPLLSTHSFRAVVTGALCLTPFAFELLFTIARRLATGAELATGDRMHSYDLLAQRLGSRPKSTIAFWLVGAGCLAAAVSGALTDDGLTVAVSALVLAAALLAGRVLWRWLPASQPRQIDIADATSE